MKTLQKYFAFMKIAIAEGLRLSPSLVGKVLFYLLVTYILSKVWSVTPLGSQFSMSAADLVWYVTITEWIVVSTPLVLTEIEKDVQSGDIICGLCRPMSYIWTHVARGFGSFLLQATILGVAGVIFAYCLTGQFLSHPEALLWGVPMGLLSGFLSIVFNVSIGISAFWLFDSSPFYWLWQKSSFVLGGLILPLSIYPGWLRTISECTPFAAILYGSAQTIVGGDPSFALRNAVILGVWTIIGLGLMHGLFSMGVKKLDIGGG